MKLCWANINKIRDTKSVVALDKKTKQTVKDLQEKVELLVAYIDKLVIKDESMKKVFETIRMI